MTKHRRTTQVETARATLEANGAVVTGIDWDHKHPRVNYLFNGVARFVTFASTPSDRNSDDHVRQKILRALGVKKTTKAVGARRRGRRTAVRAVEAPLPPQLTPGPDPWTPLERHELADEVTRLRLDRAWAAFWDDIKADLGIHGPWLEPVAARQEAA